MLHELIENAKLKTSNIVYSNKSARDSFYQSQIWRNKRTEILKRDNHECQVAKSMGQVVTYKLIIHYIKPLDYFPELAMGDSNLITVSHQVHDIINELNETKFDDE